MEVKNTHKKCTSEERRKKLGQPVIRPRFEPADVRIAVKSATSLTV